MRRLKALRLLPTISILAGACLAICCGVIITAVNAQAPGLNTPPPPPPPAGSNTPSDADRGDKPTILKRNTAPTVPEPIFDPVRAHKDLEIGSYLLKTGNYKAAIDRLQEAAQLQPGLAEPFRLLGKTYEKSHDVRNAVGAYRKYLEVYPHAPDREAVQKEIDRLTVRLDRAGKQ